MKKTRRFRKGVSFFLALAMVIGMINIPMSANAETASEKAAVSVYPTPQSIVTDSESGMKLNGTIDLVVHGTQDEATLPKVEELLKAEGYKFETKDAIGENAAIVIAVDCDDEACAICNSVSDSAGALEKEQGYVLKSSDDSNKNGMITIIGADTDGAYYGVMTLLQMFDQKTSDGRIAEVTISDYPDVPFRGYVEGFYGIPWSYEDRAELFRDTTLYKMNTYIYAPKDDPYHRGSWRTLYPEDKAKEISDLTKIAAENNMEFCWTIHPGADYNYTKDSDGDGLVDDYETIIAKFEQVYSLGVRQFGIFYDDLDYSVANGIQHATVINDAYAYLTEKYDDVKPFITVVTRYTNSWGASMSSYFTPFMQNIHEDTIVLWTGNSTMSAVTKAYFEWPQTNTGVDRDFGVWWNYPVNDYCNGHLLMAPLDCLDNDVDNICSFFLNPMSEADASKVAIYSGADYSWNIADFNSKESWSRAIEELVPEANEEFERFADNISYLTQGNGFFFDESVYMKEDLESFEAALASGEGLEAEIQNMAAIFKQMQSDAETLKTIESEKLLEEITAHLDAYNALAEAGIAAMEGFAAALSGNIEQSLAKIDVLESSLKESTSYRVKTLGGSAQAYVGTYRIAPFLEDMSEQIMNVLNANLKSTVDERMFTNVENLEVKEVEQKSGAYLVENITAVMNKDDYVAIALPKVMNIYEISAEVTPADNFELQYSLNGIEWQDIEATVVDGRLVTDEIVTAAYARLVCTADGTNAVITNLEVAPAYEAVFATVSTDMPTYQSYTVDKAVDGDLSTLFWSSTGSSNGNYICVDMGARAKLGTIDFYSGINKHGVVDAYASTQLEVSTDGSVWQKVGEAKPISEFVNQENNLSKLTFEAGGVEARYFRLVAVGASESWLMAYEIDYEAEYIDYENRAVVETNMDIYQNYTEEKAVDGDMTTWMWSYHRLADGTEYGSYKDDYVQVDLGALVPLYDTSIYFGKNTQNPEYAVDGFSSVKLQTSVDGKTWKDAAEVINKDAFVEEGDCYLATFKTDGSLVRYIRFVADADYRSWAKVYEINYNQTLQAISSGTVTTNLKTYQSYVIGNAMDGDMDTKYYSSSATSAGDYVQVDLGKAISVYDATIYFGGSPNNDATAIDGFGKMKLQVSTDGSTWTDVSEELANTQYELIGGKYVATLNAGGASARYVRFTATEACKNWIQVYEIKFNKTIDTNAVRYTEGTVNISQSNYLDDGKLETAPTIYNVKENDTLIYPTTTITSVATIGIFQETNAISNAKVSVQYVDGTWAEVGTLSSAWNQFVINDTVLAVKLTFDGSIDPVIYEILITEKLEAADYTAVDAALAKVPSDLNVYTNETADKVNAAVNNVVRDLDITKQAEVDAMAKAIEEAVACLEYKPADYSKVEEAIAKIPAEEELSKYTEDSLEKLLTALENVVEGKNITEQAEVDAMAKALEAAIAGLKEIPVVEEPEDDEKPSEDDKKPSEDGKESTEDKEDDKQSPASGDSSMIMVYVALMAVCMVVFVIRKRREQA